MRLTEGTHGPWAGVLGHPVGHSLSPVMHRAAYQVLDAGIRYGSEDIEAAALADTVFPARRDPSWRGFSVTMPLKSEACRFADRLTGFAQKVGVINTLARVADPNPDDPAGGEGRVLGHNTDVAGIVNALSLTGLSAGPEPRAAIVGGGGTATAAAAALHVLGASRCTVFVRDESRAHRVADVAGRIGMDLDFEPLDRAPERLEDFDHVVSTLPARAFDEYATKITGDLGGTAVLDVSYDPWPSELSNAVEAHGGTAVSGREMLLYQAVDQIKLFVGQSLVEDLPNQQHVITAMASALGLPARTFVPRTVCDDALLQPRR
ncbi:MAG: shikimate dehydrogenase [Kocuria sp.]|nr:shikimate dehydrogenase [Kocuria sp.]